MKTDQSEAGKILRRPIQARNTKWATAIARWLARIGLRPNQISLLSLLCGALAGICLFLSGQSSSRSISVVLLIGAAAFIQLRLLCNLFDGMVAVEGGFKTKSGEIFNELPDRFSDVFVFLGAGYSMPGNHLVEALGWAACVSALLTAYVRALGGASGATQPFCGPMAKQHRMAIVTITCLIAAFARGMDWSLQIMTYVLLAIIAGCLITIFRRTILIIRDLEAK
jgi:phosphatidylglycerophosphate synthase